MKKIVICSLLALVGLTGCSASFDTRSVKPDVLADQVSKSLEQSVGKKPDAVTCAKGLNAAKGKTARCVLTDGDTKYGVTVTSTGVEDGKVNFDIKVDSVPLD